MTKGKVPQRERIQKRSAQLTGKDRDQGAQAHHKRWFGLKVADLLCQLTPWARPVLASLHHPTRLSREIQALRIGRASCLLQRQSSSLVADKNLRKLW